MSVSIVTVVKNDGGALYKTFLSLRDHLSRISKWVIVDGGSGSSLCDDIYAQCALSPNIVIIEGIDNGIYNAMNIGASYVQDDDYLWWLNAGDELLCIPDLEIGCDVVYAPVYIREIGRVSDLAVFEWLRGRGFFPVSVFWHQGFFVKKRVYSRYMYDESLLLAADLLLMSQCQRNEAFSCLEYPVAIYSINGVSNKHLIAWVIEYIAVAQKMGLSVFDLPGKSYAMIVRRIVKSLLSFGLRFFRGRLSNFIDSR